MKSLKAQGNRLAETAVQLQVLEGETSWMPFQQRLDEMGMLPLKPVGLDILQVNVGKMCNQVCKHCHVDAGPDRKEIMDRQTMEQCLDVLRSNETFGIVDITGGAPEMNPHFRWFVEQIKSLGRHVMVRCNLTIILANPRYHSLPQFFKYHQIEVVSSLPFYSRERTDRQRGDGVFESSIAALRMLNEAGYGMPGSGLLLNLVYNPAGAFLPPAQNSLEKEYKEVLNREFGISFNSLYAITNMPVSRYLDYLLKSGNYVRYMEKLMSSFNPAAVFGLMCRNTISVSWDGYLYDCDFNQMLNLPVSPEAKHISNFRAEQLACRDIVVGQHCFGCTAGAGSSCGGTVT